MTTDPHDGFDSGVDDADPDPDTNLILDYLSNKLGAQDAGAVEERARRDKDFRYKLADIVLLKGLVMLALEKNPEPMAAECQRTQRLFLDYLKGRTNVAKTAQLSRHLEQCFECEVAYERFREGGPSTKPAPSRKRPAWTRRPLAIAVLVAIGLAAGALGVFGFLTSAAAPTDGARAHQGTLALSAAESDLAAAIDEVIAANPEPGSDGKLRALVDSVRDPSTTPIERRKLYSDIGRQFGPKAGILLWKLAAREPKEVGRAVAYEAITAGSPGFVDGLISATRHEMLLSNGLAFRLLAKLAAEPAAEARRFVDELLFDPEKPAEWRVQVLRAVYKPLQGDPRIEERLASALADPSEHVRSSAVLAGSEAGNQSALPVARGLLESADASVRFFAATAVARLAPEAEVRELLELPWRSDDEQGIRTAALQRGISLPRDP
jgi:HEAT repeat protein